MGGHFDVIWASAVQFLIEFLVFLAAYRCRIGLTCGECNRCCDTARLAFLDFYSLDFSIQVLLLLLLLLSTRSQGQSDCREWAANRPSSPLYLDGIDWRRSQEHGAVRFRAEKAVQGTKTMVAVVWPTPNEYQHMARNDSVTTYLPLDWASYLSVRPSFSLSNSTRFRILCFALSSRGYVGHTILAVGLVLVLVLVRCSMLVTPLSTIRKPVALASFPSSF